MTRPAAAHLTEELAAAGFLFLGGFAPEASSKVPPLSDGRPARSLLLIGSTGPSLWPAFRASPEFSDAAPDPLDRYSKRVLNGLARIFALEALFPFEGPPYHPFQQWALECGGFSQSPLGVLAHRDYGPWAGFRAVFLSANPFADAALSPEPGPCETCKDKPCLTVCPVDAISLEDGYRVADCRGHLAEDKTRDCWSGCLARRACPFGQEHRQSAETSGFHMESFLGL
ncbi:hypothetical protein [Roseibium sp.]|uniref:hypothetical protein n=2 Tax=Roseibium sp. TaxID=1936156 RepID=UPI003D0CB4DC